MATALFKHSYQLRVRAAGYRADTPHGMSLTAAVLSGRCYNRQPCTIVRAETRHSGTLTTGSRGGSPIKNGHNLLHTYSSGCGLPVVLLVMYDGCVT